MAYDKNTWKSGDVVTSAKLNNIENGIANCNGLITGTYDEGTGAVTLSVSYNDVLAMINTGIFPFIVQEQPDNEEDFKYIMMIEVYGVDSGDYFVSTPSTTFKAKSADELLVFVDDSGEG